MKSVSAMVRIFLESMDISLLTQNKPSIPASYSSILEKPVLFS